MQPRGESAERPGTKDERIRFPVERDGAELVRAWVERTVAIYRDAIANLRPHASKAEHRRRFRDAIRDFESWLAAGSGASSEGQSPCRPGIGDLVSGADRVGRHRCSSYMPL